MTRIEINTDGSCLGNPGPGGWAASIIRYSNGAAIKNRTVKGNANATTNNKMELVAAIAALQCIKRSEAAPITIRSDSQYLIKGMTEWRFGWQSKNWRSANGKPVSNQNLWHDLIDLSAGLSIEWMWVKGHSGDAANDQVDTLARTEAQTALARQSS